MLGGYLRKKWIKFLKEYFSFKSLGICCLLPGFVYMFLSHWANKQVMVNSLYETAAESHGSCIHENKYPFQDNKYNCHDSLQRISEGINSAKLLADIMK